MNIEIGDTVYYVDCRHDSYDDDILTLTIEKLIVIEKGWQNKLGRYADVCEMTEEIPYYCLRHVHDDLLFNTKEKALEYALHLLNKVKYGEI